MGTAQAFENPPGRCGQMENGGPAQEFPRSSLTADISNQLLHLGPEAGPESMHYGHHTIHQTWHERGHLCALLDWTEMV